MYPDAPLIKREGEVNAWDNEEFRNAIKATNRTQIIIAGIVTDVCMYTLWTYPFEQGTDREPRHCLPGPFAPRRGLLRLGQPRG
jgi:hypothetical protein